MKLPLYFHSHSNVSSSTLRSHFTKSSPISLLPLKFLHSLPMSPLPARQSEACGARGSKKSSVETATTSYCRPSSWWECACLCSLKLNTSNTARTYRPLFLCRHLCRLHVRTVLCFCVDCRHMCILYACAGKCVKVHACRYACVGKCVKVHA